MSIAFAETASTGGWTAESFGGLIILALIIFLVVRHKKKKNIKKSSAEKQKQNVAVTTVENVPGVNVNRMAFTDDPSLISIAKFQKVVYKQFVVFDLETTGLNPVSDRIVEIGAVRVLDGKIVDRYQQLINPGISMPADASEKNHITDQMLKGCPRIEKVLPDFLAFAGDDVLAAHNAGFDLNFLKEACLKQHLGVPESYFDTMRLSVYWPGLKNKKLETFLKAAGIENKEAHRALGDAEATAELIVKSFAKLK